MRKDDEFVAQTEPRGALSKEDLESAEEVHIPDYVMLDFGLLEGRGTSRK
jgi:hypothetical protein